MTFFPFLCVHISAIWLGPMGFVKTYKFVEKNLKGVR
jgi:hypothetical protein